MAQIELRVTSGQFEVFTTPSDMSMSISIQFIYEKYIRNMMKETRIVLLNTHEKWPTSIEIELRTFTFIMYPLTGIIL